MSSRVAPTNLGTRPRAADPGKEGLGGTTSPSSTDR
jgi:hypothetical protein